MAFSPPFGGLPHANKEAATNSPITHISNVLGHHVNEAVDHASDVAAYFQSILANNIGNPFQEGKIMERVELEYYARLWNAKISTDDYDPESYTGLCFPMGSTQGNLFALWNAMDYLSGKKILVDQKQGSMVRGPRRAVNMKAILPAEQRTNGYTPIAFYPEDAHYSMAKPSVTLGLSTFSEVGEVKYPGECPITNDGAWPMGVPSRDSGAINIDNLAVLVDFFASKGYPILVCFNYGTSSKGAYDDVASACQKLEPIFEKYGLLKREVKYDDKGETKVDIRTGYWIHVNGELGAAYMPYIEMAYDAGRIPEKGPCFDFRLPMVHSIAMNGHRGTGAPFQNGVYMTRLKYQMMPPESPEYIGTLDTSVAESLKSMRSSTLLWDKIAGHSQEDQREEATDREGIPAYMQGTGAPFQTGLYMTRTKFQMGPENTPEYIGTPDTTVAGSLNKQSAMRRLWDNIAGHSDEDQIQKSLDREEMAAYMESRLRYLQGEVLKTDLYVERTPLSLTVRFKRASEEVCEKYSLLRYEDLEGRQYSEAFVMEHVTKNLVDAFIEDLSKDGAFPE